eukprot:2209166-Pleurochrysis_carterae.AAC.1
MEATVCTGSDEAHLSALQAASRASKQSRGFASAELGTSELRRRGAYRQATVASTVSMNMFDVCEKAFQFDHAELTSSGLRFVSEMTFHSTDKTPQNLFVGTVSQPM